MVVSLNFAFLADHDPQLVRLGGLAEQYFASDPNDEPASVLLERIQAERAKREAEAKAAKKSTGKATGQLSRKAKQQDSESIQLGLPGVE